MALYFLLVRAIKLLHAVSISDCPFTSDIKMRLKELDYLLASDLADVDISNWQDATDFTEPQELYRWLRENKPQEDFVFSHGDLGANIFIKDDEIYFYDLARCGVADRWLDVAFCVRDIREYYPNFDYERVFFELLNIKPDYERIDYYILLYEMF